MDVSGEDECNEFGLFTFLERGTASQLMLVLLTLPNEPTLSYDYFCFLIDQEQGLTFNKNDVLKCCLS